MPLPHLSDASVRAGSTPQSYQRGQDLYQRGAISSATIQETTLRGQCEGSMVPYYSVQVELDKAGVRTATCTCDYVYDGYCKHIVALLLAFIHEPEQFAQQRSPKDMIAPLGRDDLAAILTKLLRNHPDLTNEVETALTLLNQKGKTPKQKRKAKVDVSAYTRQVRGIFHGLDDMRMSEAYWHAGNVTGQLEQVQASAIEFLEADDAETALAILMVLAEESLKGVELVDDSDGELGDFAIGLGMPMAEAILSMDLSKAERSTWRKKLEALNARLDNYGMGGLDVAIEAATYGWDSDSPATAPAITQTTRSHWAEDKQLIDEGGLDYDDFIYVGYDQDFTHAGDLIEAKLNVLNRRKDDEAFLELSARTGRHLRAVFKLLDLNRVPEAVTFAKSHLTQTDEAYEIGKRLHTLNHPDHVEDAIAVGESGLNLEGRKSLLGEWLAPLEEAQGRKTQALGAWQAAFFDHPKLDTYKAIKRLARANWATLQPELMKVLHKLFDQHILAEVLLFEAQWDEAIVIANAHLDDDRLVALVADGVIDQRPAWVMKASREQAEALIELTQSKYYAEAAGWLKRMKRAHEVLGQTREWKAYLTQLKEQYKRRPALQKQLQTL